MDKINGHYSVVYKVKSIHEAKKAMTCLRKKMWSPFTTYSFFTSPVGTPHAYVCADVLFFTRTQSIDIHNETSKKTIEDAKLFFHC